MFRKPWAPVVMSITLAALLGGGFAARSQMQHQQASPPSIVPNRLPPIDSNGDADDAQVARRMQIKQVEKRNQDRQAQLVQDTNRLFDLAKELKDQVGKTNEDILSVDVVKEAAEIEKLAKSVREKMKAN